MRVHSPQSAVRSQRPFWGIVFCLLSFIFCLSGGCTPDPEPTLNYKDREVVDSLFRMEVEKMKPILDSLCEVRRDSAVQFKVDSMMRVRQSEIERYLERIKREQNEQ